VSQDRIGIALITDSPAGKGMRFLTFPDRQGAGTQGGHRRRRALHPQDQDLLQQRRERRGDALQPWPAARAPNRSAELPDVRNHQFPRTPSRDGG
jgi:hypothetical protein